MREGAKRVLLVGNGEFYHVGAFFRHALVALGRDHRFVDEAEYFNVPGRFLSRAVSRLVGRGALARRRFNRDVFEAARHFRPHVVLVIKGAYLAHDALAEIKTVTRATLINYATDDPFNPASSTPQVRASIPLYDLYCTTKRAIIPDLRQAGARCIAYVPFGYEPALHFPERPSGPAEAARWSSDLMFAGGCDPDRARFFTALVQRVDLNVHLYGGYWNRHSELRRFWRGFVLGRDYRIALGCAKSAPCLVRRSNRDGHVMRTFEIPACGSFMLAERTEEHSELFEEGKEIACFDTPEELADKVLYYLAHEDERRRFAEAGYRRVTSGGHTYQDRLVHVLQLAA